MSYLERFSILRKKVLVTGGSKGIGAVAAHLLAEAGADVAITGRDRAGLEETRIAPTQRGFRECSLPDPLLIGLITRI